jgi:hypothetical protein
LFPDDLARNPNDPAFLPPPPVFGPDVAWGQYLEGMGIGRRNRPDPNGEWEDIPDVDNITGDNPLQADILRRTEQREEERRNRERGEINELRERLAQGRRRLENIQRRGLSAADRRDMREVDEELRQMEDELTARQRRLDTGQRQGDFLAEYTGPDSRPHQGDFLNGDADSDTGPDPYEKLLEATDRFGRDTLAALRQLGDRLG